MRYYGIRKKRNTDDILYQGFKLRRKLNYLVEFNKEEKKRKKENYKYEFSKEFQLERSNQIPEGNFYEPVSIIATDLIANFNFCLLVNQRKAAYCFAKIRCTGIAPMRVAHVTGRAQRPGSL